MFNTTNHRSEIRTLDVRHRFRHCVALMDIDKASFLLLFAMVIYPFSLSPGPIV